MSQIVPFSFESKEVRVVLDEGGEPWVVAKDVATVLGYTWHHNVIGHVPEEWKGSRPITTPGGIQTVLCLSEQGLYFFLGRSDKPKALPFQKWLAGEVVPSIRKTGAYGMPVEPPGPKAPLTYLEALQRVIELQQQLLQSRPVHVEGARPVGRTTSARAARSSPSARARTEHPWTPSIRSWIQHHPDQQEVTTTQLLGDALGLGVVTSRAQMDIGRVMSGLGWSRARRRTDGKLRWVYTRPGSA